MTTVANLRATDLERRRALRQRSYDLVGRKLARLVREYEERHGSTPSPPSSAPVAIPGDEEVEEEIAKGA